jgi:hypothetical protein
MVLPDAMSPAVADRTAGREFIESVRARIAEAKRPRPGNLA